MPVVHRPDRSIEEVRVHFRRTLSAWAADVLELRRRGLHRPMMRRRPDDAVSGQPAAAEDGRHEQHEASS